MSKPAVPFVREAIERLLQRFEHGDYNPTPIIDLGTLVANADGVVDAHEIETLQQILEPLLGAQLDSELVGYLVNASLSVIKSAGVEPRMRVLSEILMDCDAVEEGITVALAVAYASDGLSEAERSLVMQLAKLCELETGRVAELIKRVGSEMERQNPA
jgi:tellurite resistance protein